MRNIETDMPISIKQMLEEDEKLCKQIGDLILLNMGAPMSDEEVTLRARLRQVRSCLKDSLDPNKKYLVSTGNEEGDEEDENSERTERI
jgi:hypothetical protein